MGNGAGPRVPHQVRTPALDKRHSQLSGKELELIQNHQRNRHRCPGETLPEQLGARCQAQASLLDDLDVVVGEANRSKSQCGKDGNPDEGVGGIAPEHRGQQNRNPDEHAAHGGSAGLLQVRLWPVVADKLADLKLAQLLNHPWTDEQRDQQRRERGKGGAEGEVAEDAKRVKERKELFVKQPVKQRASSAGVRLVSA